MNRQAGGKDFQDCLHSPHRLATTRGLPSPERSHGTLEDDLALVDDGQFIADLFGDFHHVCGKEHALSDFCTFAHYLLEFECGLGVESYHGFVQYPVLRIVQKARHYAQLLLHAAAHAADRRCQRVQEAETPRVFLDSLPALFRRHAEDIGDEIQIFMGFEPIEQFWIVVDETYSPFGGRADSLSLKCHRRGWCRYRDREPRKERVLSLFCLRHWDPGSRRFFHRVRSTRGNRRLCGRFSRRFSRFRQVGSRFSPQFGAFALFGQEYYKLMRL